MSIVPLLCISFLKARQSVSQGISFNAVGSQIVIAFIYPLM
jgi:hypothetical protein